MSSSNLHMFQNSQRFSISGGKFQVAGRDIVTVEGGVKYQGLSWLYNEISQSALHDAEARYPPPQCHPGTREKALQSLGDWASSGLNASGDEARPVYWLYGSAGAGKSAIAQTLAERRAGNKTLAASFFFWRSDPSRNTPRNLFTTIAFQLAFTIPELAGLINTAILGRPHILTSSIDIQFKELILYPSMRSQVLHELHVFHGHTVSKTYLMIIDGLDECSNSHDQQRILSILADG
ncbi:hypothetical protein BT96DRAFT_994658 [Gymnopus androsaceus JB14]|uniref:Nephrocystin 3-like N-terminal domain-containing protein n=1 Tax=Gymnopus androsaceus JB14 TaxID=1447944 RepID=A0A6A4HP71_9AGAR|nr:hypothetical protein BT96DRAFT_994658 [Gymnopus androsaceus JB14]